MNQDTKIGGSQERFPPTHWSAIVAARSDNPQERTRALDVLIATYWKPVYKYIRIKWNKSNEDAKDLTQGFFTQAMEKDFFNGYDPARARFRTFLRTCLDGYVANENKAAARIKRGGNACILSLDFEKAEGEMKHAGAPDPASLNEYFDREWMRSLFTLAIETFREECKNKGKSTCFDVFERYDLNTDDTEEKPTYDALAGEFDLPVSQITNYLAYARREFRRIMLDKLREITVDEEEFRREARLVLGVNPQ